MNVWKKNCCKNVKLLEITVNTNAFLSLNFKWKTFVTVKKIDAAETETLQRIIKL